MRESGEKFPASTSSSPPPPPGTAEAMRESYDAQPYESYALSAAHIEVLAVEAMVAGLTPAPLERCRVLELGCASGGNLLPMAEQFPGSEFVGIDLSPVQIGQAVRLAEQVGIRNAKLVAMDLVNAGE